MAKYLITGGAGFIGSNIAEALIKSNQSVRILDNLVTGKFENIQSFVSKTDFICGELSEYLIAQKAVDGVDYIIHQAAIPSVPYSIANPIAANESMVTATVNLFKAALEAKTVKRIVQATSSSAYGDSPALPKVETMTPNPLSPYAVGKLTQEYYGKAFYNVYGLEVLSLRYFNVFGPKQDPHSFYSAVIPKFISLMIEGNQPLVYGDGLASRDFIYVDNVVEANLLACKCKWSGDAEVINIGCGEKITINDLILYINNLLGTDIKPIYAESRAGDIKHSIADISKAREILGYFPKVDVNEGLKRLIEYTKIKQKFAKC